MKDGLCNWLANCCLTTLCLNKDVSYFLRAWNWHYHSYTCTVGLSGWSATQCLMLRRVECIDLLQGVSS